MPVSILPLSPSGLHENINKNKKEKLATVPTIKYKKECSQEAGPYHSNHYITSTQSTQNCTTQLNSKYKYTEHKHSALRVRCFISRCYFPTCYILHSLSHILLVPITPEPTITANYIYYNYSKLKLQSPLNYLSSNLLAY